MQDKNLSKLILPIDTMIEELGYVDYYMKKHNHCYGAVISFDFSKRETKCSEYAMTYAVTGDNFQQALDDFKASDLSKGLTESDYNHPVFSIQAEVGSREK